MHLRYLVVMRSRRKARESVLQALYSCDLLSDWSLSSARATLEHFQKDFLHSQDITICDNLKFAFTLLEGIITARDLIDARIAAASERWSIRRMLIIDRNILRLATYELLFAEDVPRNVSLNEAIEIAKTYGGPDTPVFVNGVLDKIANTEEPIPLQHRVENLS